jgi:hypothetical protein
VAVLADDEMVVHGNPERARECGMAELAKRRA